MNDVLLPPLHGTHHPSTRREGTGPGSFALAPELGGPKTFSSPDDEDLDVDTDFCAMCGHDWCSVRISKEIVEFASGKAEGFAREGVLPSPALSEEQRAVLEQRGVLSLDDLHRLATKTRSAMGEDTSSPACHCAKADDATAQQVQSERLVPIGRLTQNPAE